MKTIKIGTQTWSAENLDVDHYKNGDVIPEVKNPEEWSNLKTGAWCYYGNDNKIGKNHGKLYNWYAVNDPRGLAPEGWHIPTKEEFNKLKSLVHGSSNSIKAERAGEGGGVGTNESRFSALLSGFRYDNGDFDGLCYCTYYWSSTEFNDNSVYDLTMEYINNNISILDSNKGDGFSVRLVKNKE